MEPELTVLIASHKREDMLAQALDSLELQTIDHEKFEVVIVKDYDIPGGLLEGRSFLIRVFDSDIPDFWKKHLVGVSNASGKYICFLDDDDLFSRFKLERISDLTKIDNADFIVNSKVFFNDGDVVNDIQSVNKDFQQFYDLGTKVPKDLFKKIPWYNCSSMTISSDMAKKHVHFIENITKDIDTFWFLVGLENARSIVYDQNGLTFYRRHQGGVSRSNDVHKLCNYAVSAIANLSTMNSIFSSKTAKKLIQYNTSEWKAKAVLLGCIKSGKQKFLSIFSLLQFINTFSRKWITVLLALLLISFISTRIAQDVYPRFYK